MTYQNYKKLVLEEVINYYAERTGETVEKIKSLMEALPLFYEEVKAKVNDVMIEMLSKDAPQDLLAQLHKVLGK